MLTVRDYARAWGEASISFLDHLLILCLAIGLPAILSGVAAHHLIDGDVDSYGRWFVVRTAADLILNTVAIAAALWLSRRESFFRPSFGEVIASLYTDGERVALLALIFVILSKPVIFFFDPSPLLIVLPMAKFCFVALLLPFLNLPRWLEGAGELFGGQRWGVLLAIAPLLFAWVFVQLAFVGWDGWSLERSTPLMFGLDLVVRGLLAAWAWSVLFRLYRIGDER